MSQKTPKLDSSQLMRLFLGKEYDTILEVFLNAFRELSTFSYEAMTPPLQRKLNRFIELFLFFFSADEITLSPRMAERFIPLNATISNTISLTTFKNSDNQIVLLHERMQNDRGSDLGKILTLFSARNTVDLDRSVFFDINPKLASLWWMHFFDLYTSALVKDIGYAQLNLHLLSLDSRLEFQGNINRIAFASTYINGENDRGTKEALNSWIQKTVPQTSLKSSEHYKKNKIAIFSGCWRDTHAVYKNQLYAIESLREDYELTFFPLRENQDTSLFHKVDESFLTLPLDLAKTQDFDFQLAYYPDVGMTYQSMVLSNLRIAPVQVTSFGHSVSSYGGDLDYYIVGEEIEDVDFYKKNYSERLVVLPGLGIVHKPFSDEIVSPSENENDEIIIGCGWSSQKCNIQSFLQLQRLIESSSKPLIFRFLVGSGVLRDNAFLPFQTAVMEILGESQVEIITHLPYNEYLTKLNECNFLLDSFHFGGCNTIIDALLLKKPIITRMGDKWYNRVGGAELRAVGLDELVTESEEEFFNLALKCIEDKAFLSKVSKKIAKLDLQGSRLFDKSEADHFKKAIDYLVENHEKLKEESEKSPIYIK